MFHSLQPEPQLSQPLSELHSPSLLFQNLSYSQPALPSLLQPALMSLSPPVIQGCSSTWLIFILVYGFLSSSFKSRSFASLLTGSHTSCSNEISFLIVITPISFSSRLSKGRWRPSSKYTTTPKDQMSTVFS